MRGADPTGKAALIPDTFWSVWTDPSQLRRQMRPDLSTRESQNPPHHAFNNHYSAFSVPLKTYGARFHLLTRYSICTNSSSCSIYQTGISTPLGLACRTCLIDHATKPSLLANLEDTPEKLNSDVAQGNLTFQKTSYILPTRSPDTKKQSKYPLSLQNGVEKIPLNCNDRHVSGVPFNGCLKTRI
jgi:hypothetical protein